ncbi:hypothetical protein KW782_03485 [Candidatus Parcubacteria bacterium]|nr:hypothetical protein [Candidatus Parcubacteria bacterium]
MSLKKIRKLKPKSKVWVYTRCADGRDGYTKCVLKRFEPTERSGIYLVQYSGFASYQEYKINGVRWYKKV